MAISSKSIMEKFTNHLLNHSLINTYLLSTHCIVGTMHFWREIQQYMLRVLKIFMTFVSVFVLSEIYCKELIIDAQIDFCSLQHGEEKNGCDINFHQ